LGLLAEAPSGPSSDNVFSSLWHSADRYRGVLVVFQLSDLPDCTGRSANKNLPRLFGDPTIDKSDQEFGGDIRWNIRDIRRWSVVPCPDIFCRLARTYDWLLIALINIFFGWTVFIWIAALGWAATPVQGLWPTLKTIGRHTAPLIAQAEQKLSDAREGMDRHPLLRDAGRKLDRALGGKLVRYEPPEEGTRSLVDDWSLSRNLDGGIVLVCRLHLPMGTKLAVSFTFEGRPSPASTVQHTLDSGGMLRLPPVLEAGRPFRPGRYILRIETLPFEFGVQDDWIVDAVGERGKGLPHSATQPVDREFPQSGRLMREDIIVEFPPISLQTQAIEAVKQKTFADTSATRLRPIEDIIRDRFAARQDEQRSPDRAWAAEQVGEDRWIVSLSFTRRGRPQAARWEVNSMSSDIRYLDPDAKAMSIG
jgi:hypothetical protein